MMSRTKILFVIALLTLFSPLVIADYDVMLPMESTDSGNYAVSGNVAGTEDTNFLIDTGASLSTISRSLFEKIKSHRDVIHVRKIAARLANGKFQSAEVYRISNFVIGKQCKMAPIEVAVMPSNGRNILGMNALAMTAPFGLNPQKMALAVSRCQSPILDAENSLAFVK